MLHQITWGQYGTAVAAALAVYYAIIALKYYRHEIQQFAAYKKVAVTNGPAIADIEEDTDTMWATQDEDKGFHDIPQVQKEETDALLQQAEELTPKLKAAIAKASEQEYTQQEFIFSIQQLLQQYSLLNVPAFRTAINNLIASECDKHGNLHLDADELAIVWKK